VKTKAAEMAVKILKVRKQGLADSQMSVDKSKQEESNEDVEIKD